MTLIFSRNEIKDEYFKHIENKDAKRFIVKTLLEKVKDHDICIENLKSVFLDCVMMIKHGTTIEELLVEGDLINL